MQGLCGNETSIYIEDELGMAVALDEAAPTAGPGDIAYELEDMFPFGSSFSDVGTESVEFDSEYGTRTTEFDGADEEDVPSSAFEELE